jgi:hypothetical protein
MTTVATGQFPPTGLSPAGKAASIAAPNPSLYETFIHYTSPVLPAHKERHDGAVTGPGFDLKVVSEHSTALDAAIKSGLIALQFDLVRIAPLLKNESFCEEKSGD